MIAQQYRKAEITVFLTLLLSSICLFLCTLIESGRLAILRFEIETITQTGLLSTFAEYERNMLSRYDLFYIDSGYLGSMDCKIDSFLEHFAEYVNENLDTEGTGELTGLTLADVKADSYSLATDGRGGVLMNQATDYIENYCSITFYPRGESILNTMQSVKTEGFVGRWDSLIEESEAMGAVFNNPARMVRNQCRDEYGIVTGGVNLQLGAQPYSDLPSVRAVVNGNADVHQNSNIRAFNEYIMRKCGCVTYDAGAGPLKCETEYITYGNSSDQENLKTVISELMSVREGANLSTIKGSDEMLSAVEAYTWMFMDMYDDPALFDVLKEAIIYSWAYAEAAVEIHGLLIGGKCPEGVGSEGWIVDINELVGFMNYMGQSRGVGNTYREFMSAFICMVPSEIKRMRLCDIIEMNIRAMGNYNFKIDGCIEYANITAYYESDYGYSKHITRDHTYVR